MAKGLQEFGLDPGGGLEAEAFVAEWGDDASLGGAFHVAFLDEVGLVDFFEGSGFFTDGDGETADAYGAASEFGENGVEHAFVHFVEAIAVDIEHGEGLIGNIAGDFVVGADLGVVAHPAEEVVGDAGGAAAAGGDFEGTGVIDIDIENAGGALDDLFKFFVGVVVEAVAHAEAGAEGGREQAHAGGGADKGKAGEIETNGSGVGALVDEDIDDKILHGGVEVFFDGAGNAVDFVDEENVAFFEAGEEAGEVARFVDGRAGGGTDVYTHLFAKDVGEGGFAESGRAGEEDVVENIPAPARGLHEQFQAFADFVLAHVVGETGGAQTDIEGLIDLDEFFTGKFIMGRRRIHTHVLAVRLQGGNVFWGKCTNSLYTKHYSCIH